MQTKLIGALALLMVLAGACSRQETARTLADRLSQADRVIVLNAYDGAAMTIKGDLLKQLVQAIATAPEIPNGELLTITPGYILVFCSPNVHIATVQTGGHSVFYIDKIAYNDKSGALSVASLRFDEKQHSGSQPSVAP